MQEVDDMMPTDLKLRHNPRLKNVTFDKAADDGIEYGTFPYETDIYNNMNMPMPINQSAFRIYDPMNPRRMVHHKQKRRW